MSIRVMHVVDSLGQGGLENGLVNLVRRLDDARFEHVVCTLRGLGPNAERLSGGRVRVVPLPMTAVSSRLQTPALVRVIRGVRPDIVHSRNWAAIEAVMAARLAGGCAVVHSEHGLEAGASIDEPRRRTWLRRLAFELADRVLSVSSELRHLHSLRTGYPAWKIAVIHNGVDCSRFAPDHGIRTRVREELQIGEEDFCVGCVANLLPVKDHMTLLKALDLVACSTRSWRLLLIGEGPEREKLQAFVDSRTALKERVCLLGASHRVPELLQAMDVFVLPSVAEGICNALLEAMATGVAVVATAVGGNPEVIVDGESGLLFTPRDVRGLGDRLQRLEASPADRQSLAHGALRRVRRNFSIESMVTAYEQLYESVRPATTVPALSGG